MKPLAPYMAIGLSTVITGIAERRHIRYNLENIEEAMRAFCEKREVGPKELFMPVRIAVTGRAATPPLFDTMAVLGKEVCRSRLRRAIEVVRSMK